MNNIFGYDFEKTFINKILLKINIYFNQEQFVNFKILKDSFAKKS